LLNTAAYTFPGADPIKHDTYIVKLDFKLNASGTHSLFVRGNLQNDHERQPPQFPGQPPLLSSRITAKASQPVTRR
jgi:hypothetical protein